MRQMLERSGAIKSLAIALVALTGAIALTGVPSVGARSPKVVKVAKNVSTIFFSRGTRTGFEFHATSANARYKRLVLDEEGAATRQKAGWTPVCCGRIFFIKRNRFISMRLDGSAQRRHARDPDPNADGSLNQRRGLFAYLPLDDPPRIELMNVRSGKRRTVYVVSPAQSDPTDPNAVPVPVISQPTTSPGGQKIAFTLDRHCPPPDFTCLPTELWVVNSDGSDPHVVLNDADGVEDFSFSPQASRIVFNDEVNGTQDDLFSVGVGGGNPVQVTNTPGISEEDPIYSPNASRIAYRDLVNANLYTINAAGGGRTRLTNRLTTGKYRRGFDVAEVWLKARWEKRRGR